MPARGPEQPTAHQRCETGCRSAAGASGHANARKQMPVLGKTGLALRVCSWARGQRHTNSQHFDKNLLGSILSRCQGQYGKQRHTGFQPRGPHVEGVRDCPSAGRLGWDENCSCGAGLPLIVQQHDQRSENDLIDYQHVSLWWRAPRTDGNVGACVVAVESPRDVSKVCR